MSEKIVISLGKYYYPTKGGVEKVTKDIAEIVADVGFKSSVVSFDGQKKPFSHTNINGVNVIRYESFKIGPAPFSWQFLKDANSLFDKADLLITHYPNPLVEKALLKYDRNKRIILFYHSDLVGYNKIITQWYNRHTKKLLEKVNVIISTSPNYVNSSKILNHYTEKLRIVPLTINPKDFNLTKKYDFKNFSYKYKILFVGRFVKYKGVEYLIKAMKYLDQNVGLVLVGGGPRYKLYKKLVKKEKITHRVFFILNPSNDDLKSIYNSADVFVLPSTMRSEAFGIASLEAMYAGLPIITTELGTGTSFYNIQKKTGIIVKPKDEREIAEAIEISLKNKSEFGKNAKQVVETQFVIDNFKTKIIEIIQDILIGNMLS